MELLELLASCIEQGRTSIAPTLVGPLERERLDRLQRLGAMTLMPAQVIFCPHCEIRTVRVIAVGSGFCIDCGLVNLTTKDTQRLAPDGDAPVGKFGTSVRSTTRSICSPGRITLDQYR